MTGKVAAALHKARIAEPAFLELWPEADKALFRQFMADQEALHKDQSLAELNDKVARQSSLVAQFAAHERCVNEGKLSVAAMLHATLTALRRCQLVATRKAQAEHADGQKKPSGRRLQVRRCLRF